MDNLKEINIGTWFQSKMSNKFVIQNINVDDNDYIANVAFKNNKYKNIIYLKY